MITKAGALLKEARLRAGLRQRELAQRANVAQSLISAYESGKREPTLPTLRRLVVATGHDLTLGLAPASRPSRAFSGPIGAKVRSNRRRLRQVLRSHGIQSAQVFGSVARGEDHPDSDLDLLVDLPAGTGIFALTTLVRELEEVLGAPVDVVPTDGLKSHLRDEVDSELVRL